MKALSIYIANIRITPFNAINGRVYSFFPFEQEIKTQYYYLTLLKEAKPFKIEIPDDWTFIYDRNEMLSPDGECYGAAAIIAFGRLRLYQIKILEEPR